MPKFTTQSVINANINDAFAVIIAVENYSTFVPYCTACEVISTANGIISADMSIRFGFIVVRYNSNTIYTPPNSSIATCSSNIITTSSDPIFTHMESRWNLEKADNITKIKLSINIEFCNPLYNKLLALFFDQECKKIMTAFIKRLNSLNNQKI